MTRGLLYIGLMSGTSMDAVDAVLLAVAGNRCTVEGSLAQPMPDDLRADLMRLSQPGADHIDLLGATDRRLGMLFADTALALVDRQDLTSNDITAIGSHGQTIRHRPNPSDPTRHFSLQISDPGTIAAITGITTVADFRRKDMALGGEGAPLVPAFHQHVFRHPTNDRAVINIGGIANITYLPHAGSDAPVIGFDTGPGNCLMDGWIERHLNKPFDDQGSWAATGRVHGELLDRLLGEPYLTRLPPKSTGRETFNLPWLDRLLATLDEPLSGVDVQATLCRFSAESIARGLAQLPADGAPGEIYLCGGGAFNSQLVKDLAGALPNTRISTTAALGLDPRHIEGAAFAWLAHQTINRLPGSLASVTGARRNAILGGIYYA